ncbi:MAG: hypothetical protein WCD76_08855 [Pyrinomonadaceae bacterium]
MNCTRVEKLLPFHAGGDLEDEATRRTVAAHLQTCERCRAVSAEWTANQHLLQLHEPPDFDEAFFDGLRRDVLRQIEEEEARPSFFLFLAQLFNARTLAYVSAAALVFAATVITIYVNNSKQPSGDVANVGTTTLTRSPQEAGPSPLSQATPDPLRNKDVAVAALATAQGREDVLGHVTTLHRFGHRASVSRANAVRREAPRDANDASSRAASIGHDQTLPGVVASLPPTLNADAAPAVRKILRIEMQTADPNVRIIWLSPQAPDSILQTNSTHNR